MLRFCPLVLLAAACLRAAAPPLVLAEDGKSGYSICISVEASASERRGAAELQRFVREMSGAELPVAEEPCRGDLVFVGRSAALDRLRPGIPYDRLGPEGFALKTLGRNLAIAGGRQRGSMYGVYTFLESLGCRWFTSEVSRIPKMAVIRVPALNETHKPAFEYREPYIAEAFEKEWAARNRTNGAHSRLDASTGGKVEYYPFVHSFNQMVPPARYFKEHPEYFSLIDGERRMERSQLCLTNPDVLRVSVNSVREWIRRHPEATIISVSQNDWEGWCECDNCRRVEQEEGGAHSGPLLRFVNAVAAEIEKTNPDKLIDTLAYWYTEDPPLKVRPRRNVRIRLCPIGVCESHPYEQCSRSAYFVRNLKAWSKITNQLYIWHYNTNFSHYLAPFPDFDQLAASIPLYQRNGVVGIFLEGAYPPGGGGENAELRAYVSAKLLWDPAIDVNRAVGEFIEGVFGRAARPMRAYYDLMQKQARAGQHIWINPVPEYSPAFLREARGLFEEAEGLADDDAVRGRVRKQRLAIDYMDLLRAKTYGVRDGVYAPADLDGFKKQAAGFLDAVRGFGMTSLHEGRNLGVDEQDFGNLKAYRLVSLENEVLRVEVAPEMSGRVIRMSRQAHGARGAAPSRFRGARLSRSGRNRSLGLSRFSRPRVGRRLERGILARPPRAGRPGPERGDAAPYPEAGRRGTADRNRRDRRRPGRTGAAIAGRFRSRRHQSRRRELPAAERRRVHAANDRARAAAHRFRVVHRRGAAGCRMAGDGPEQPIRQWRSRAVLRQLDGQGRRAGDTRNLVQTGEAGSGGKHAAGVRLRCGAGFGRGAPQVKQMPRPAVRGRAMCYPAASNG